MTSYIWAGADSKYRHSHRSVLNVHCMCWSCAWLWICTISNHLLTNVQQNHWQIPSQLYMRNAYWKVKPTNTAFIFYVALRPIQLTQQKFALWIHPWGFSQMTSSLSSLCKRCLYENNTGLSIVLKKQYFCNMQYIYVLCCLFS